MPLFLVRFIWATGILILIIKAKYTEEIQTWLNARSQLCQDRGENSGNKVRLSSIIQEAKEKQGTRDYWVKEQEEDELSPSGGLWRSHPCCFSVPTKTPYGFHLFLVWSNHHDSFFYIMFCFLALNIFFL